jgi:hypothetical protein
MATLYYNNATEDGDWATLGNWWTNAACTSAAAALPASSDSVEMTTYCTQNTGGEPTVANLLMTGIGDASGGNGVLSISITVTGLATFANAAEYSTGTLTGNASFSGGGNGSYYNVAGTIDGSAIFEDGARNFGEVTGDAAFADGDNFGLIGGNAVFDRASNADGGATQGYVTGDAIFRGYGEYYNHYNCTVEGNAEFYDGTYNYGGVLGNATFNDYAFNNEYIGGDATFNDFSRFAYGTIGGTATFNDYSYVESPISGTVVLDNSAWITAYAAGTNAIIEFRGNSYNVNGISGTLTVAHGGCINGSSILGVV